MPYPTELAPKPYFLTATDNLGERANASLAALQEHGFVVGVGLTEQFIPDMATLSAEKDIEDYCPNDKKRFGTVEAAAKWQSRGRGHVTIYATPFNYDTAPLEQSDIHQLAEEDMLRGIVHGWSGYAPNKHIPGADITTAYRVGALGTELARARSGKADRLRMGLHLGEMVLGTAVHIFGANPQQISEEHWKSNDRARRLYRDLGFEERIIGDPELRPTTQRVGSVVDGNKVRVGMSAEKLVKQVEDSRIHGVLTNHPLLTAA